MNDWSLAMPFGALGFLYVIQVKPNGLFSGRLLFFAVSSNPIVTIMCSVPK